MGCKVTQTETEATVQGPPAGQLKAIEEVDMEIMTDAFLTATVVAAVASGKTRILRIANQRVKERNWITRTMIDRLAYIKVVVVDLASLHATGSQAECSNMSRDEAMSIFLIGMRGTGKTFVGELAPSALGWTFVDADRYLETELCQAFANRNEITHFFKHSTGGQPNLAHNVEPGRSCLLFLVYPDVQQAFSCIQELMEDVDAMELRVD
ncbi:hypothetical protein H1R20_g1599, partial [Candolleomyces eurysporus]